MSIQNKKKQQWHRQYTAGIYARLSVENKNEKDESIESQTAAAQSYLEAQPDIVLYGCYSDLGKTGTHFNRPGFAGLMADVYAGKINCIIVKDFSRLGRNYIETGNYIQKIFPDLGVRFISVTDRYDSCRKNFDELGMHLKNLANELYVKDISRKVKSVRQAQQDQGSYTGAAAPYGYVLRHAEGKRYLVQNSDACSVVKEIFCLFNAKKTITEIVRQLYKEGVHRPKDSRRYGHVYVRKGEQLFEWPRDTIKAVLRNPVYMGCLVRSKTDGSTIKEHTHEAVVTNEQFFTAAQRLERLQADCRKRMNTGTGLTQPDVFQNILFCGCCGAKMYRTCHSKKTASGGMQKIYGYYCSNAAKIDGRSCGRKYTACHILEQLVMASLRKEAALSGIKTETLLKSFEEAQNERIKDLRKELNQILREQRAKNSTKSRQYVSYQKGRIDREVFLNKAAQLKRRQKELEEQRLQVSGRLEEAVNQAEIQKSRLKEAFFFDENAQPDRELLGALIKKISVFPDQRIQISFRFVSVLPSDSLCNLDTT